MAQDSIRMKKNNSKWSLKFNIENNFNFRYVKKPNFLKYGYPVNYDYTQEDWDYLDSCNIACNMKSFNIIFERKIWNFLSFQSGLIYGSKGIVGCRDIVADDVGRLILIYTEVPFKTYTIPIGISINRDFIKSRIILNLNSGFEINLISSQEQNSSYGRRTIAGMQVGYFGFDALRKTDNQLSFKEDSRPNAIQYYVGLNLKIKVIKNIFINLGYNYISDFKFYEVSDNLYLGGTVYERKSYIHRYGGGIGFMF
jgi:hypothetical protein